MYLVENTLIHNNYKVINHILTTKECILYKCIALDTNENVVATEYFPSKIAYRNEEQFVILPANQIRYFEENLATFTNDAEVIMNNDSEGVFGVLGVYLEKGTCYIITRMDGELLPFKEYFIQNPDSDVTLYFSDIISTCSHFFEAGASIPVMENNVFVDKSTSRIKLAYLYERGFEEKNAVKSIASMFISAIKGNKKIETEPKEGRDEFLRYLSDIVESRIKINSLNDFEKEISEKVEIMDRYEAGPKGLAAADLKPNSTESMMVAITAVVFTIIVAATIIYFGAQVLSNSEYKKVVPTPKYIEVEFDRH